MVPVQQAKRVIYASYSKRRREPVVDLYWYLYLVLEVNLTQYFIPYGLRNVIHF